MDSYLRVFCLFSTYLDTLFCNLALLHAFCSGLDSYLRLCGPGTYLMSAKRRPTTWLKIGSPWLIAGLQAIGQLAVSDRETARLFGDCKGRTPHSPTHFANQFEAACVITDPNFLIMRTSIAYALPLIACLVLTGFQTKRLRRLRHEPPRALKSLLLVRKQCGKGHKKQTALSHDLPLRTPTPAPLSKQIRKHGRLRMAKGQTQPPPRTVSALKCATVATSGSYGTIRHTANSDTPTRSESVIFGSRGTLNFGMQRDITNETLVAPTSTVTDPPLTRSNTCDTFDTMTSTGIALVQIADLEGSTVVEQSTSVHDCPRHGRIALSTGRNTCSFDYGDGPDTNRRVAVALISSDGYRLVEQPVALSAVVSTVEASDAGLTWSPVPSLKPRNGRHVTTSTNHPRQVSRKDMAIWLQAYRGEQMAVAINMVSCIVAVGVWSPLILSSLAHGLCQLPEPVTLQQTIYYVPGLDTNQFHQSPPNPCFIQVTVARLADFRWWAYASTGLLLPLVLLLMDTELRKSCWRSLGFSARHKRFTVQHHLFPLHNLNIHQDTVPENLQQIAGRELLQTSSCAGESSCGAGWPSGTVQGPLLTRLQTESSRINTNYDSTPNNLYK